MKTKYMSRKFIVAVCGLGISLIALILNNDVIALAGIALAGCFVIGESIVDKAGAVKRNINVTENVSPRREASPNGKTSIGDNNGIKDKT